MSLYFYQLCSTVIYFEFWPAVTSYDAIYHLHLAQGVLLCPLSWFPRLFSFSTICLRLSAGCFSSVRIPSLRHLGLNLASSRPLKSSVGFNLATISQGFVVSLSTMHRVAAWKPAVDRCWGRRRSDDLVLVSEASSARWCLRFAQATASTSRTLPDRCLPSVRFVLSNVQSNPILFLWLISIYNF